MENQNQQQQTTEGIAVPPPPEEFNMRKAFHDGGEAMYFIAIVGIATTVLTVSRFMAFAKMAITAPPGDANQVHQVSKPFQIKKVIYEKRKIAPLGLLPLVAISSVKIKSGMSAKKIKKVNGPNHEAPKNTPYKTDKPKTVFLFIVQEKHFVN